MKRLVYIPFLGFEKRIQNCAEPALSSTAQVVYH